MSLTSGIVISTVGRPSTMVNGSAISRPHANSTTELQSCASALPHHRNATRSFSVVRPAYCRRIELGSCDERGPCVAAQRLRAFPNQPEVSGLTRCDAHVRRATRDCSGRAGGLPESELNHAPVPAAGPELPDGRGSPPSGCADGRRHDRHGSRLCQNAGELRCRRANVCASAARDLQSDGPVVTRSP